MRAHFLGFKVFWISLTLYEHEIPITSSPNRTTTRLQVGGIPNLVLDVHTRDITRVNDPGRRYTLSGASGASSGFLLFLVLLNLHFQ